MTAATSAARPGPYSPQYRMLTWGVFAMILGIAFEFMAVATALPVAAKELGGLSLFPWALTGFLGAVMFANGIAGEVCDRIGPRLPLIIGSLTFTVGLLVSGLAVSMPMLIVGRVVQGLGAGFTIVAVYVVIAQYYPDDIRPRMMSMLATAWVVPSVVGPFIAGGLTEFVSWRWAFLILVPIVPAPLFVVLPKVSASSRTEIRRENRVRLAATLATGAVIVQWAGLEAEKSRWLTAVIAVVIGLVLIVVAVRQLFPAGFLRLRRGLPSVVAYRGVMAGGFFGCQAYVPLMLVEHRGATPTLAGLAVATTAIGWSSGSWFQGRPTLQWRRTSLVRIGAVVVSAGVLVTATAALVTDAITVPAWVSGLGLLIGGLGMGLGMASNAVLLFDYSPPQDRGANSAAIQMSDSLGGLLVIGGAGVFYAVFRESMGATALFGVIFSLAFAVMLLAIFVAFRVRTPAYPTL